MKKFINGFSNNRKTNETGTSGWNTKRPLIILGANENWLFSETKIKVNASIFY